MLKVRNIHKEYSKSKVLKGITTQIEEGKITALIGPSGSGKTTLLKCMSLIELPSRGYWEFNNKKRIFPNKKKPKKTHFPVLSVVFQQFFLWPHLRNIDNINIVKPKMSNEDFKKLTHDLRISDCLDKFPYQSSIGQKQRVALARALVLKPKILLLDEITSSLDIRQIKIIEEIVITLKNNDVGMLIISHNIDFIRNVADKVIYIEDGLIREEGSTEILQNPKTEFLANFIYGKY